MPTEKKEKDKKLKKASKKGATPAVVEVLDAKPDSAAEALASGYVSSSEGSLGEDQTTDSQLTQARSPSPGTPSEDIQEPSFSPQQEYIAYETKKNKDKKEKKKSKDKKKDKKKTEIVGGSVSSATPPQSPTSPKKTPPSPRTAIVEEPPVPAYAAQILPPDSYEEKEQYTGMGDQMFQAITDYFTKGNSRPENEKRAILMGQAKEGSLVRIAPGANVRLAEGYTLGDNVYIGLFCYVNGSVQIDEDVTVGPHCSITSNNHLFNPSTQSFKGTNENKPIHIQRGSWIAAGCTITAGTSIGECVLVCAGAVVTRDVPAYSIVAGIPARTVGFIDPGTGEKTWNK